MKPICHSRKLEPARASFGSHFPHDIGGLEALASASLRVVWRS